MTATRTSWTHAAWLVPLALAGTGWAGWAPSARADSIDKELIGTAADEIMETLKDRKYQNVGVLKFRVKVGNREPSFDVGLLNSNMATRLENALILANDEKAPIGITRSASQVAARTFKVNSLNPDELKKLFAGKYLLAWGPPKQEGVQVDAFLTGLVELSPDLKQATVSIQLFDQQKPALQNILSFRAPTDRSVLSDSGMSFSLVKRDIKLRVRGDVMDNEAIEDAVQRLEGKPRPNDNAVEKLVDLKIFYNGTQQKVIVDDTSSTRKIAEPPANAKIHFTVRSTERVALVLRINGLNTLGMEGADKQLEECSKWVLEPNKDYTIKGFYMADNRVLPFEVRSPRDLNDLDLDKKGLIEVAVFREDPNVSTSKDFANLRGLGLSSTRPATLKDLKNQLYRSSRMQTKGIIVPGSPSGSVEVKTTRFESPDLAGTLTIRYYP